jgi:hypothetical protein
MGSAGTDDWTLPAMAVCIGRVGRRIGNALAIGFDPGHDVVVVSGPGSRRAPLNERSAELLMGALDVLGGGVGGAACLRQAALGARRAARARTGSGTPDPLPGLRDPATRLATLGLQSHYASMTVAAMRTLHTGHPCTLTFTSEASVLTWYAQERDTLEALAEDPRVGEWFTEALKLFPPVPE